MQLDELVEQQIEVVGQHRSIGMAGDLNGFPRIKLAVNRADGFSKLSAQRADLIAQLGRLLFRLLKLSDLLLELVDRLFECQSVGATCHLVCNSEDKPQRHEGHKEDQEEK